MKVVMDVREAQLERVGVSVYCENIIREFVNIEDDFDFVFIASSDMPKLDIKLGNHKIKYIAPSHTGSIFEKLRWYFYLPRMLKQLNADLYFGPFLKIPFCSYPCKTIFTLHDAASITEGQLVGSPLMKLKNKYFTSNWVNNVDGIICISNYCKDEFYNIYGEKVRERSTVIYHGLPHELAEPYDFDSSEECQVLNKFTSQKRYLITVGTVYPKKNIELLIKAFSKIKSVDVELLICGAAGPNSDSIFTAPRRYNVVDNVKFLGRVDNDQLRVLLKNAEAFIFPSLYEGFGLPILEAFSMEVPVVSSNATCLPEVAGNGALFFDPNSSTEISKAIDLILDDDKLAGELISKGRDRLSYFSWAKSAEQHKAFFIEIFNR